MFFENAYMYIFSFLLYNNQFIYWKTMEKIYEKFKKTWTLSFQSWKKFIYFFFFGDLKTLKGHFKINWPLACSRMEDTGEATSHSSSSEDVTKELKKNIQTNKETNKETIEQNKKIPHRFERKITKCSLFGGNRYLILDNFLFFC